MENIESIVTSFCKRTKTAGVPWAQVVERFMQMYPPISQEDFEPCMLRQGKRAAVAIKDSCATHTYEQAHKVLRVTRGFWDACQSSRRPRNSSVPVMKKGYRRNPTTKIYMTVFRVPASEYTKESLGILKQFVESLERPMEIIECTNPPAIEIREIR